MPCKASHLLRAIGFRVAEVVADVRSCLVLAQDKDFFGEIHKNFLAKRLLNNRSKSDDLEKSMIGHLKIECGAQFTQPLEVRECVWGVRSARFQRRLVGWLVVG